MSEEVFLIFKRRKRRFIKEKKSANIPVFICSRENEV